MNKRTPSSITPPPKRGNGGDVYSGDFLLRGRRVRIDDQGRVCINDLHKAGRFSVNQKPSDWIALGNTTALAIKVLEKTTGKSGHFSKSQILSVVCSRVGRGGGVWVHPNLALAYAKYLSADLHYEVNDVFLRYKSGDAKLADEVLQRSDAADNEWAGVRALGRAKRKQLTAVLKEHEVTAPRDFAIVTNDTYKGLWGKDARRIRADKGLPPKGGSLRDAMDTDELVFLMASERLASERIEDEDRRGVKQCGEAARKSAANIARAIAADRADRQPRPRP